MTSYPFLAMGFSLGCALVALEWPLLARVLNREPAPRPTLPLLATLSLIYGGVLSLVWLSRTAFAAAAPRAAWDDALVGYVAPHLLLLVWAYQAARARSRGALKLDSRGAVALHTTWRAVIALLAGATLCVSGASAYMWLAGNTPAVSLTASILAAAAAAFLLRVRARH